MKKLLLFLPLSLCIGMLWSCSEKNEPTPAPEPEPDDSQVVVSCSILQPSVGTEWISDTPLTIKGNAAVNVGTIQTVTLTVGGVAISDVDKVPFTYEYAAPEDLAEGELEISLAVVGSAGASSNTTISVVHKKPQPVDDGNQEGDDDGKKDEDDDGKDDGQQEDGLTLTDTRDGKVYRTVTIGTQTWMAENLAWLPEVSPAALAAEDGNVKRYFVLNYDGTDVAAAKATEEYGLYGVLYNWFAANGTESDSGASAEAVPSGVQGACPDGWHLPSKAEWQILEEYVGAELPAVTGTNKSYETDENMKNVWSALAALEVWGESMMTYENPDMVNGARDLYGFSVVPAGKCWQSGSFGYSDADTGFWATDMQAYGGGCVEFSNSYYYIMYTKSGYSTKRGYSVRCVKD